MPKNDDVLIKRDDQDPRVNNAVLAQDSTYNPNNTQNQVSNPPGQPPQPAGRSGEDTMSGSHPDPETDDNALDSAQAVGLYTEASEENPHELDIAEEVDEAEQSLKDAQPL